MGLHTSRPLGFDLGARSHLFHAQGCKDQREEQICTHVSSTKERKRGRLSETRRAGFALEKYPGSMEEPLFGAIDFTQSSK